MLTNGTSWISIHLNSAAFALISKDSTFPGCEKYVINHDCQYFNVTYEYNEWNGGVFNHFPDTIVRVDENMVED